MNLPKYTYLHIIYENGMYKISQTSEPPDIDMFELKENENIFSIPLKVNQEKYLYQLSWKKNYSTVMKYNTSIMYENFTVDHENYWAVEKDFYSVWLIITEKNYCVVRCKII
jgi:hypothetical protein